MTDKFHTIKFWNEKSSRVTKREYISVEAIHEWEKETRAELFKKFDGHISIGITLAFDELLKFIKP